MQKFMPTVEELMIEPEGFDYSQLDISTRAVVQSAARAIKYRQARAKEDLILIGKHLDSVKEMLPHGQFEQWCKLEFDMSPRTARNLMNVARRFADKSETVSVLSDSVLYLLAAPSTPDEAITAAEEAARAGETVTKAKALEIIRAQRAPDKNQFEPLPVWKIEQALEPVIDRLAGGGHEGEIAPSARRAMLLSLKRQGAKHPDWQAVMDALPDGARMREVTQAISNLAEQALQKEREAEAAPAQAFDWGPWETVHDRPTGDWYGRSVRLRLATGRYDTDEQARRAVKNGETSQEWEDYWRILGSLRTVPPHDVNFKSALDDASIAILQEALQTIPPEGNKVRIERIQSRLKALEREAENSGNSLLQVFEEAPEPLPDGWRIEAWPDASGFVGLHEQKYVATDKFPKPDDAHRAVLAGEYTLLACMEWEQAAERARTPAELPVAEGAIFDATAAMAELEPPAYAGTNVAIAPATPLAEELPVADSRPRSTRISDLLESARKFRNTVLESIGELTGEHVAVNRARLALDPLIESLERNLVPYKEKR